MLRNPLEEPHVFSTYFLLSYTENSSILSHNLFNMQGCEIITQTLMGTATLCYWGDFYFKHFVICFPCLSPGSHQRYTPSLTHSLNPPAYLAATSRWSQCEKRANHSIMLHFSRRALLCKTVHRPDGCAKFCYDGSHANMGTKSAEFYLKTSVSGPFQRGLNRHRPELQVVCKVNKKWPLSSLFLWCFFFFGLLELTWSWCAARKLQEVYSALSNKLI